MKAFFGAIAAFLAFGLSGCGGPGSEATQSLPSAETFQVVKISDLGFWSFRQILGHMTSKAGSQIGTVGRYFPSTKLCHSCGSLNDNLKDLRVRSWTCDCGVTHDRDHNAAVNILLEGASSSGLGDVRRVLAPAVAV